MNQIGKPLIICAPEPRTIDLIFSAPKKAELFANYEVVETKTGQVSSLPIQTLSGARYIIGQPALALNTLSQMQNLKCIFNVEGNLLNNMPYDYLFAKGIHVVTSSSVFAEPVAEMGLTMALCLLRRIISSSNDFVEGKEIYGKKSNLNSKQLSGSNIGIIGFGDIGQKLAQLLKGFRANIRVFDPWLPSSLMDSNDVKLTSLNDLLSSSDVVFVLASATTENKEFLDKHMFAKMRPGALFILLSRADVVNFDHLIDSVRSGHILAASDVYPEEPVPKEHPIRSLDGFLNSAHRAGSLDSAYKKMGVMVLEDMHLLDRGLPPQCCKRAERETIQTMRSRPVG